MLNQCNFIGRLGRDPEIRYTRNSIPVANFSIACSEKRNGQEYTEWVNVAAWDKLAEICRQYLTKGQLVFVSGRMQTRKWQDQSGADRYTTEIVAREMRMLGGGRELPQSASPPAPSGRGPEQGPGQASLFEGGGREAAGGSPRHNPPGYEDVPF
jgi:single-strand DNA-binding protein